MRYLFILLTGCLWASSCENIKEQTPEWPEITAENKPWTRWWWHGSAVTKEGITSELDSLKKAGIGGVEITPIFGVRSEEDNFIEFLSPQWMKMLLHTLKEADSLGLGVDMATGTGWPFGGPWIDDQHAPKKIVHKTYHLSGGETLAEAIGYEQEALVRAVGKQLSIEDVKYPVAANDNLQELALDQVHFPKKLPLVTLMAYEENGEPINLTGLISDGKLNWTAPEGEWDLYAVFQGWHGKMVERAAPGGEGNVIDHFSKDALNVYLEKFDSAFHGKNLSSLRAFFNDSYEVDDARGQANWSPGFFQAFQKQHGYDLRNYLPALFGESDAEINRRVLTDYRATIAQLIFENFTTEWKAWGAKNEGLIRNQAHGSPANILDLYAEVDIPETEGTEMLKIKFASSAANVTGKQLASSEAATWLKDHFRSSLADIRKNLERYILGGINHVFYHGTAYSPDDAKWPGWLFYAAIHANDRNTWWNDFSKLNEYIARVQSFMQASDPDNDLLVYFPIYDRYAEAGHGLLEHFDIRGDFYESSVKKAGDTLLAKGVAFDFISDRQIQNLSVSDGKIRTGDSAYKTILIPATAFIPIATMEKLLDLSRSGVNVLFHQQLPEDVPGLANLENRQAQFKELKEKLASTANLSNSLDELLETGNVPVETLVQEGLQFIRKTYEDNRLYFIANWSEQPVDRYVPLAKGKPHAYIMDPMTGRKGIGQTSGDAVYLQLAPGESSLILVSTKPFGGDPYAYYQNMKRISINGPWQVHFTKGGPVLPKDYFLDALSSWTDFAGEEGEAFSGTATYRATFNKPENNQKAYLLDLGEVHESAEVYLNGTLIETLIGPEYRVVVPAEKLKKHNELKIAVSNLMANRIRYMDMEGLTYKKFYNVNFPAYQKENREDGLFHADHWVPMPSGLLGPVHISPLKEKEF